MSMKFKDSEMREPSKFSRYKLYTEEDILNSNNHQKTPKAKAARLLQADVPFVAQKQVFKIRLQIQPKQFLVLYLCRIITEINPQATLIIQGQKLYIISKIAQRVAKQYNIITTFFNQFVAKRLKLNSQVFYEEIQYALQRKHRCTVYKPETVYWACCKIQKKYPQFRGIISITDQYLQALHKKQRQFIVIIKKEYSKQAMEIIRTVIGSPNSLKISDVMQQNHRNSNHPQANYQAKRQKQTRTNCSIPAKSLKKKTFAQDEKSQRKEIVEVIQENGKKINTGQQAEISQEKARAQCIITKLKQTSINEKEQLDSIIQLASKEKFKHQICYMRVLYYIARKKIEAGKFKESEIEVNKLLQLAPRQRSILKLQIDLFCDTNRWQEALDIFQRHKSLQQMYFDLYQNVIFEVQERSSFDLKQDTFFQESNEQSSFTKNLKFTQS